MCNILVQLQCKILSVNDPFLTATKAHKLKHNIIYYNLCSNEVDVANEHRICLHILCSLKKGCFKGGWEGAISPPLCNSQWKTLCKCNNQQYAKQQASVLDISRLQVTQAACQTHKTQKGSSDAVGVCDEIEIVRLQKDNYSSCMLYHGML